jgi:serine/threonine protein kinase KIN1/2
MATSVANGVGPAPIVSAQESRPQGKSGKSRTTIPAPSGTFVLGKTVSKSTIIERLESSPLNAPMRHLLIMSSSQIGAGSMGKVKLARKVEGGEQV